MPRLLVDVSPLRASRDFRLLFSGQLVSMMGNQITIVAVAIQVWDLTHSTLQVGAISLVSLPFLVIGSLYGGTVGDVVDKRRLLAFSALGLSALTGAIAVNAAVAHPSLVALYALTALAAGLTGFSNPSRNAAVPRLVAGDKLLAAYSLNQTTIQLATVVGPALGGVIAAFSLPAAYVTDAVSFFAIFAATLAMSPLPPLTHARRPGLGAIREGFSYLRGRQVLQGVYLLDLNAMILGMPSALFPAFAAQRFHAGSVVVGLLYAAPGVGGFLGAFTTGWVGGVRRRGRAVVVAVVVWGLAIAAFGISSILWVALVLLAIAGWADVISAILRNTILQQSIGEEFRTRLSSIQMAVVTGGPRLGNFEAGAVAALTTPAISAVSGGLGCAVGALLLAWRLPRFTAEVAPGR
ncbi:MAG TPA: MFS transporter [Acidimicrobiales bacterium]|jgi:MFS family permease|nr:MFS transporter [Acidimicrobiales bacterium]